MASGVEDDKNRSVGTEHHHHQPPPLPLEQQKSAQPYVPGYAVTGTGHVAEHPLPCCGLGIGWFLFIIGFILGAIPWYIGFFLLLFSKNRREKPGYIACAIVSAVATIIIVSGVVRAVWFRSHYPNAY